MSQQLRNCQRQSRQPCAHPDSGVASEHHALSDLGLSESAAERCLAGYPRLPPADHIEQHHTCHHQGSYAKGQARILWPILSLVVQDLSLDTGNVALLLWRTTLVGLVRLRAPTRAVHDLGVLLVTRAAACKLIA